MVTKWLDVCMGHKHASKLLWRIDKESDLAIVCKKICIIIIEYSLRTFVNTKRQPHKLVKHTQTIRRLLSTNCLSVFDQFVGLVLKGLRLVLKWDTLSCNLLYYNKILMSKCNLFYYGQRTHNVYLYIPHYCLVAYHILRISIAEIIPIFDLCLLEWHHRKSTVFQTTFLSFEFGLTVILHFRWYLSL